MADEIELKLTLPETVSGKRVSYSPAKIAAAFALEQPKPAKSQHLQNSYFDTEDGWLRSRGMALRIRRIGRQRLQTLKAPTTEVAGAQAYQEFEIAIAGDVPDLTLIPDIGLRQDLMDADIAQRLQPTFSTNFRRTTWEIGCAGSQIEMALDRGMIIAGDQQRPILELELELKQGDPAALFELAETVVDRLPFQLGHQSKAARGYRLRAGQAAKPAKATPLDLPPNCDVAEAFTLIAAHCMASLHANELAVIENEDPEGIHQFRVALRRLRSIIRAYRDLMDEGVYRQMSSDLQWLQRQFGPARDLDVFIAETLTPIRKRFSDHNGIELLLDAARCRCLAARHHAHETLQQPRYAAIQLSIYRLLATQGWRRTSATASLSIPAADFADRLLKRRHKNLRQGGGDGRIPEPELHQLRVAGKKMRYLGEAFHAFYKQKAYRQYSARLTAIQDCLGALNDAFVGANLMADLVTELRATEVLTAGQADHVTGLVQGWQASRIDTNLHAFRSVWHDFLKADKYWGRR